MKKTGTKKHLLRRGLRGNGNQQLSGVRFLVIRQRPGEEGSTHAAKSITGQFQINLLGSSKDFSSLAKALTKFACCDSDNDADYHEHLTGLLSIDGKTKVELILRKDDLGTAGWRSLEKKTRPRRKTRATSPAS